MKKQPLVSVIMNCYNGERYLTNSLQSVLNQDYKNWELIFWDNKSKDNSKKIFMKFKDHRFKYYHAKKFTNLYTARNLAIRKAKGKIISFIDVDDMWLPKKLKKNVEFFKKNKNAEILYSNYFVQRYFFGIKYRELKYKRLLPSGNIMKKLLKFYPIGWVTVSLKRNLIKNNKKLFDESLDMVADFDLMIRLALKKKIFCIQEPLAVYRYHRNQLSRSNFFKQIEHFLKWVNLAKKRKVIDNLKKYDLIREKTLFFKEIKLIKSGNYSYSRYLSFFLSGNIKLFIKLLLFFLFPNLFIKYVISL